MSHKPRDRYDYVLIGGGLQSGLIALALQHHQPESSVLLIERDGEIAGNHTWSFHSADIAEECLPWFDPLVVRSWPYYEIRFGESSRRVNLRYASIPANHFRELVVRSFCLSGSQETFEKRSIEREAVTSKPVYEDRSVAIFEPKVASKRMMLVNTNAVYVAEHHVITNGEKTFFAETVIDCRGPSGDQSPFFACGYQKFFGFEIKLRQPWPLKAPVLMDHCEDQTDGFRFNYTLPFDARRVLVEDTRFSDCPTINRQECLAQVRQYLRAIGINDFEIVREESGVLPMPISSELQPVATSPLAGGFAGGWFHAATGYSVPMAVAFAEAIASVPSARSREAVADLAEQHRWRSEFARFLNLLLFRLVAPRHRHRIFRRFYRVLSDAAVSRFYSHQFTVRDAAKIVIGIPPTLIGLSPLRFVQAILRGDTR